MNFSLTPQADILILSALIAFSLALLSWQRGNRKDAFFFGWLMFALSVWSVTYGLIFITNNIETQFVLYCLHYLWNLAIPIFILAFILAFTNYTRLLNLKFFAVLTLPLLLNAFILFSPDLNQIIFQSIDMTLQYSQFIIQVEPGWLFWINFVVAYTIVAIALYFLVRGIKRTESKLLKKQAALLLGVILIPPVSKLLYLLDLTLFAEFDPTPMTLVIAGVVVYFNVLRYKFLELTPYTQRRLLNSLSDGVLILNHEYRIVKSNRSAREIFRKTRRELHQKPADLFLPLDDIIQEDNTENTYNKRHSAWFSNNRTYEIRKEKLLGTQGQSQGLLIIIHDITDYIRYEEQLQERNIYIESIFNHLPIGIAAHDINTGKLLEMNENFEKIYGWPSRDMKSVEDFFNRVYPEPERRAYWKKRIESDIASGDPERMRWEGVKIQTRTGDEKVVNAYNIPISGSDIMISTVEDVTDKYTIAEALRESEKNIRDIFQNMHHGFYRTGPDATITLINPAAAQMLGHDSPDDLIGENMHERPEFEKHNKDEFARLMLDQGSVRDYESTFIRKDGSEITVLLDGRPEFSEQGELLYFEGNIIDITEQRKIEQQLLQAQKLESVGRLAGGVAHDFNNILTSLSMNAEMGTMQTDSASEAHQRFTEMEDLVTKASRITRQLLQFSRKEQMEKKNVSVNELLREILKLLRKMIGEDIDIHFEPGTDLPPVYADGSQIEQVIMNLCINARDAMNEGGTLIVRSGLESNREAQSSQNGSTKDAFVCIDIMDTGKGIPEEIRDKIFDPFFTTKGPGDGTGLGLSIVHGIIQQHGGWIDMESHESKGTLFSIYLPVSRRVSQEKAQAPAEEITGGDESILLAEDDENIREAIRAVLSKFGYTVLTASNGKEALEAIHLNGGAIDMVITDVVMPMMGGNTLFYEAHKEYPDLPFLFLSGYPESVIAKKLSESMLAHFQQKPIQIPDLLREIRNTLNNT